MLLHEKGGCKAPFFYEIASVFHGFCQNIMLHLMSEYITRHDVGVQVDRVIRSP
jgi:hypothetical protein